MNDEEKINNEIHEDEPVTPERESTLEEIIETQSAEVEENMAEVEQTGGDNIAIIENGGTDQEVEEIKSVVDEITEEAEEAKEEYEEQLKNIPNFDDKVEAINRNELINNIKQTIENDFSGINSKDRQALAGYTEYTLLLEYLDTIEGNIEDSEEMKKMDANQKKEYVESLCSQCLHKIANDTQLRNFFDKNGSNLFSGNKKLDKVIKAVFSIVEHS